MKIKELVKKAHKMAKEKGFWEEEKRNIPEALLLIISEVSETTEALRKDQFAPSHVVKDLYHDLELAIGDDEFNFNPGQWKETFEKEVKNTFEDEIADTMIRLADLAGGLGIDLEKHIKLKMHYNSTRGHKHGKKF